MNQVARMLSDQATLNVEYDEKKQDKNFFYYEGKLRAHPPLSPFKGGNASQFYLYMHLKTCNFIEI